jgi:hypothetical protein
MAIGASSAFSPEAEKLSENSREPQARASRPVGRFRQLLKRPDEEFDRNQDHLANFFVGR